ncbi:2-dehydropantoate 2-reductase (Ketopantoate reductase) (KPA reductase) (KPR) [Purpureocillium takamizusanense]|uniref:2-dehydropantoate 2-reductase (Ketopantoate reductase) (KPA reductase) (KPR) n=1 Tax=Purpureocillium takamizusanense TaxID=2060973 RepID=A0A9Q8QA37_9HYPO|nr:2-dehydropantoate 2-reductase (Ketopantoate reductase) (KPA reductase) (KPR) [Purpureocillium takamizusanense]UNI16328.1 2-dehydropantoate 2-reductase (Ketopantoate reductase) (KPA reductase) (KPR) [Purpureocillium takamizusanense]
MVVPRPRHPLVRALTRVLSRRHVLSSSSSSSPFSRCHHLARHGPDPPPITLVVHRPELLAQWAASDGGIEITTLAHNSPSSSSSSSSSQVQPQQQQQQQRAGEQEQQQQHVHRSKAPFDIEFWSDAPPPRGPVREVAVIRNLFIATKASAAMPQADRLRRYLDARSAVAFAQNGMSKLWPPHGPAYVAARWPRPPGASSSSPSAAPSFLACITGHGVYSLGPFRSVHASPAGATVGPVLLNPDAATTAAQYLTKCIASAPGLDCRAVPSAELWLMQLEKLVINTSINPITAILRCKNGALFEPRARGLARLFDRLLAETSAVLQALVGHPSTAAILLRPQLPGSGSGSGAGAGSQGRDDSSSSSPDLEGQRGALRARFSHARLRDFLYDYGSRVGDNTSSMLQDVRAGKPTEIRDFNGWIVDMADFLGLSDAVPTHRALVDLVEVAAALTEDELVQRLGV